MTRRLKILNRRERMVIGLLRGQASDTVEGPLGATFHVLRDHLRGEQRTIHDPSSPFVSDDEIAVLETIADHQNGLPASPAARNDAQGDPASACAIALINAGTRLQSAPIRSSQLSWPERTPAIAAEETSRRMPAPNAASGRGTLRAKAIALAESRDVVYASQLYAIGISSQYLSLLCKTGIFERAGFARYRLARHSN